ncbi:DUF2997 domain-containing protein [Shewanella sp. 5_MG-2023]|jgi:hypothetical protein|uniref:DUF2997 domain-containing protein n=1 Tax=Shewanella sp. 5_MG-2023 TaxID=3062656 RepID=UPI0026E28360|nr:DUF2997 domain-containing protein [Shewanella sp. 5_MG-2023]MDO6639736.1 DUF2997 domain-containing protein [Shewanella sp. 5_MG-2023]
MPEQQITLTIDEEGAITAKTNGFKGEACLEALEEILGDTTGLIQVKTTDEYHQQQAVQCIETIKLRN